ncbi:MAG TPA: hypothetical protein VFV19_09735 [Candidatus Polarisedimenticolaceae bacterium]|nr:hypothetical protein [Candidatus Polarisedimenticolaceae bacterium]
MNSRAALPLSQGVLGWVAYLAAGSFLGTAWSAAAVGAWAVGTSVASTYVFFRNATEVDDRVLRAKPYREEMLTWLESGRGPEARPLETLARHTRELIWYVAAAVMTANLGALVMGAILLNYMNAYVATIVRAATRPLRAAALAWNVWSVVRVAAYIALGAAGGSLVLRFLSFRVDAAAMRGLAIAGAAGAVLDLTLKLALSRPLGRALASSIDLAAARENRFVQPTLALHLE